MAKAIIILVVTIYLLNKYVIPAINLQLEQIHRRQIRRRQQLAEWRWKRRHSAKLPRV